MAITDNVQAFDRSHMTSLRQVLLLQRDVAKAAHFYSQGLGLGVKVVTERWAELQAGGTCIALKAVDGEACVTTGYTPFLCFTVTDLQGTVQRMLSLGASMDGSIQYAAQGKVATMRAPDGHMLSLYEAADRS